MLRISWTDKVRHEEVLLRMGKTWNLCGLSNTEKFPTSYIYCGVEIIMMGNDPRSEDRVPTHKVSLIRSFERPSSKYPN